MRPPFSPFVLFSELFLIFTDTRCATVSGICHRYRDRKTKEEKAEIKKIKQDEGIVELDDDEKEKLIDLDQFTAQVWCFSWQ